MMQAIGRRYVACFNARYRRSVSEPVTVYLFGRPGRRPRPMWQRKRQPFFPTVRRAPFCVSMTRCLGP